MDNKFSNRLSSLLFYTGILVFIIASNTAHNPPGGWYQQFLPDLNGRPLADMQFLDSLTGYGITGDGSGGDTNYIIKTTNGGENWFTIFSKKRNFSKVQFLDLNTGFVSGGYDKINGYLIKTTDAGNNWVQLNTSFGGEFSGMSVLNNDTIWLADPTGLIGGLFRTTNGGGSWIRQFGGMSNNPERIYMINAMTGFFSLSSNVLYKTTNGGFNWFGVNEEGFNDIYFIDTLTGWKASGNMKKTTDGGLTWVTQSLPITIFKSLRRFSRISNDTIWGVGGTVYFSGNGEERGIIYKTTNGGITWGYQLPDTSINIFRYFHSDFVNKSIGWCYSPGPGVHTTTGGDSITYYTSINIAGINVPKIFVLYQNYPNPFNPNTIINYEIKTVSYVILKVYDISGKEIRILVNKRQTPGEYKVEFDGSGLTSGVYFYRMEITDPKNNAVYSDTKKMILLR